jgi:hypothetical protein
MAEKKLVAVRYPPWVARHGRLLVFATLGVLAALLLALPYYASAYVVRLAFLLCLWVVASAPRGSSASALTRPPCSSRGRAGSGGSPAWRPG